MNECINNEKKLFAKLQYIYIYEIKRQGHLKRLGRLPRLPNQIWQTSRGKLFWFKLGS